MNEKILAEGSNNAKKFLSTMTAIGAVLAFLVVVVYPFVLGGGLETFLWWWWQGLILVIPYVIVVALIYFAMCKTELVVTDKRVYGKTAWGKRVDLPLDSVSAIGSFQTLKGVSISTASGQINFKLIKNSDAIYQTVSRLLLERQQGKSVSMVADTSKSDDVEQLQKLKGLLNSGVITQEEFDAKKKQLLGL